MLGKGLLKGLKITGKKFFQKKITEQYPEVKPNLPKRSHGTFDFGADKCIACELCSKACPNRVINVESAKNEQGKKALQNYHMSLSHCMYCGLCTEACPTGALKFKTDFENSVYDKNEMVKTWPGKLEKVENAENNNTEA